MTKTLGTEWCDRGITVNCISPGYVDTELTRTEALSALRTQWINESPMKRLADVDDLVGGVLYLTSGLSNFTTGLNLVMDGGFSCCERGCHSLNQLWQVYPPQVEVGAEVALRIISQRSLYAGTTAGCRQLPHGLHRYIIYNKYRSSGSDKDEKKEEAEDGTLKQKDKKVVEGPPYQSLKEVGNQMFKAGDFNQALENYTKAIELLEKDEGVTGDTKAQTLSMLFQNRAAVFEKLQNWPMVIRECGNALVLNPQYVKALHRRSKAYKTTGFLDEALEDITAVCILENFSSNGSVTLADETLKLIGTREATKLIETKPPVAPSVHTVNSFLRSFYNDPVTKLWRQKKIETNGTTGSGDEEPTPFQRAVEHLRDHDYDKILPLCSAELEKSADNVDARLLRATFRHLYAYRKETLEDLDSVVNSKRASKEYKSAALIKKASYMSLLAEGDVQFEEYFQKAEEVWPENVDLWHHRGQVYLTRGMINEAQEALNRAAALEPDFGLGVATRWYMTFRMSLLQGDTEAQNTSMTEFEKIAKRFLDDPDVVNLHGQLLLEQGLFAESDMNFNRVLELDPTNATVYVHKAMSVYQKTNDQAKCLQMLRDALKIDDRNEFIYETIGTLELQSGNLPAAIEAIDKALELAKSFQEVVILTSLRKAAQVQLKLKSKMGLEIPKHIVGPGGTMNTWQ
ncbi:Mitochondrial import receptor subunit TOM70 [Orchesella cincta]|uniref:Mitochondrial import receptor subunit TOM70 n=1 Tax=Orchesella cincta TaxID=48709 RepID=A0A1D2N2U4_ORCCI|nr:Mitochondrial import receptor subunit TOM70 [Orchesella cincta]